MLEPKVRQIIVCEDARVRQGTIGKIDVFGLMNRVAAAHFPVSQTFSVYLCLTEGRGSGLGRIVVESDLGTVIYRGNLHRLEFASDPLLLYACTIPVPSCEFPAPGLVKFVYNEVDLGEFPMLVEES
jgi:hypothetical protein